MNSRRFQIFLTKN
uniref:Uncharacterized protein n=1 Tax=Rhizophora mucronata TaxID=61149 RepID=A0A2P2L1N4_RHIMU